MALALLETQVCADPPRMNLDVKWSYNARADVGDILLLDLDRDGKEDVFVGLLNTTVLTLNPKGVRIQEFAIGNASQIGGIYSIGRGDVNGDSLDELLFGLGGATEVRTYAPQDFEIKGGDTISVTPKDKVLYRVFRRHGGVYAMRAGGTPLWRYLTLDSVRSVAYQPRMVGGTVVAGVGDLVIYTYNERTEDVIEGEVCTFEDVVDEVAGWTTEADCLNHDKCCYEVEDCTCRWDSDCRDSSCKKGADGQCYKNGDICFSGTNDICYRSYTKKTCGKGATGDKIGWHYVEYSERNGTLMFLDGRGNLKDHYDVYLRDSHGKVIAGADNAIRSVSPVPILNMTPTLIVASNNGDIMALNVSNSTHAYPFWEANLSGEARVAAAGDINGDGQYEVIAGNDAGVIQSYGFRGNLLWKQRVDDAVTDIKIYDVESDGKKDIIVSSRDGNIYVFDSVGNLMWNFQTGGAVYGVEVSDIDGNGLVDFITYSRENVTRYETTEFYVKKYRADSYYNQANGRLESEDYTTASILLDRAIELYTQSDDRDGLAASRLLRARIDDEFKVKGKQEGDRYYNLALNYYAVNDLESALKQVGLARTVYRRVDDKEGVRKCDSLEATILSDRLEQRKMLADGMYLKGLSLSNFGNYTLAVEAFENAKKMFVEAGYYNETLKCDDQIIKIADRNYATALLAYQSQDWRKAMSYADIARDLYARVERMNASENAANLYRMAQESIGKPVEENKGKTDYTLYLLIAVALVLFIAISLRMKGSGAKKQVITRRLAEADEELQALGKEDA